MTRYSEAHGYATRRRSQFTRARSFNQELDIEGLLETGWTLAYKPIARQWSEAEQDRHLLRVPCFKGEGGAVGPDLSSAGGKFSTICLNPSSIPARKSTRQYGATDSKLKDGTVSSEHHESRRRPLPGEYEHDGSRPTSRLTLMILSSKPHRFR